MSKDILFLCEKGKATKKGKPGEIRCLSQAR